MSEELIFNIFLEKLKIFAYHGVLPQETVVGNFFEVSVSLDVYAHADIATDNIDYALNYAELYELVVEAMKVRRNLLECVALDIKARILERWPRVKAGKITITKVHPPICAPAARVSVSISF